MRVTLLYMKTTLINNKHRLFIYYSLLRFLIKNINCEKYNSFCSSNNNNKILIKQCEKQDTALLILHINLKT